MSLAIFAFSLSLGFHIFYVAIGLYSMHWIEQFDSIIIKEKKKNLLTYRILCYLPRMHLKYERYGRNTVGSHFSSNDVNSPL